MDDRADSQARRRLFWKVFGIALCLSVLSGGAIAGGLFGLAELRRGNAPDLTKLLRPKELTAAAILGGFFVLFSAGLAAFVARPPADSPNELPEDLAREGEPLLWSVRAALLRRIAHLDAINGYLYLTAERILFRKRRFEFFRQSDFEWSRADLERVTIRPVTIPVHHFKATLHLTSWEETSFMFRAAELETWLAGLERCDVEVVREG